MDGSSPPADDPQAHQSIEVCQQRIADLERRLDELQRSESQLRQIIDLVPDYIFAADAQGRFILVNEALARAYGLTVDQVRGAVEIDLTPDPRQSHRLMADNQEVLKSGKPTFIPEQSVVDAHGNRMTVQIRRIPYTEAGTSRCAVLGVATDITERKLFEKTRREKERIQRDVDIARRIQRGLLPVDTPDLPGFSIAGWNQSADETGGDYFDWLELPDGRLVFSIGDVSGHGIGPAMIVAVCRAYFRASTSSLSTLEEAFGRVNALLMHDLPPNRFVTVAAGLLDPAQARLQIFSAGHAPLLFYNAREDRVISWPADDLPLGISDEMGADSQAREIAFSPGDALVLVTDGFFEWEDENNEQFGTDRLSAAIRRHGQKDPEQIIAGLYNDVKRFVGETRQKDDLTAVVLKRD